MKALPYVDETKVIVCGHSEGAMIATLLSEKEDSADISTDHRRLSALRDIPYVEIFTPSNVNHILREIDDDNSIMTVKKQYLWLTAKPIHKSTKEKIKEWLSQFSNTGNGQS